MNIRSKISANTGQIALLIDPEKTNTPAQLDPIIEKAQFAKIDFFFVGGSTVTRSDIEFVCEYLKAKSSLPVVLFPGASHQLSAHADALLYLTLISGRNPDFLIGHHIQSAEEVHRMNLEVLSTSYLLIDGGKPSSVAYVSQTSPIPRDQTSIVVNTAIAGHLQGHQLIYLDAGSGALHPVPEHLILQLKQSLHNPIIVGGGIQSIATIQSLAHAGANVVVIGNKIEENIDFLLDIAAFKSEIHTTTSK